MANGSYCCAIGVCCPPDSAARRAALIAELSHGMAEKGVIADAAVKVNGASLLEHVADWLIANVDMVPKGMIDLSRIVELVKKSG
jgi:hypothetical protein